MWIWGWAKQSTGPLLNILPSRMKDAVAAFEALACLWIPCQQTACSSINRLPSSVFPLFRVPASGSSDSISHLSPLPWTEAQCLYLSTSGLMSFLHTLTESEGVDARGCCQIQESSWTTSLTTSWPSVCLWPSHLLKVILKGYAG